VPLGLLKYNPVKFFTPYFIGKLLISVAGAYLGETGQKILEPFVSQEVLMIASVIFTIAITVLLLKVDITKIFKRFKKKEFEKSDE
jgi:membrane protein DedA with SNARE-associated domain